MTGRSGFTCTLVVAAAGPLMACGPCDTSIVPSIVVEVVDSVTGEAAASGALGLATDGQYTDTLEVYALDGAGQPLSLATRGERVGNYSVRVMQTGYAVWERGISGSGRRGAIPTKPNSRRVCSLRPSPAAA
jgi:hypothetical protein